MSACGGEGVAVAVVFVAVAQFGASNVSNNKLEERRAIRQYTIIVITWLSCVFSNDCRSFERTSTPYAACLPLPAYPRKDDSHSAEQHALWIPNKTRSPSMVELVSHPKDSCLRSINTSEQPLNP